MQNMQKKRTRNSLPMANSIKQSLLLEKRAKNPVAATETVNMADAATFSLRLSASIPSPLQTRSSCHQKAILFPRKRTAETTKTQGAHKILSSNFSARRLKSRFGSSTQCVASLGGPSMPTNLGGEIRSGGHAHFKKLISLIFSFYKKEHHKNQKKTKTNFNDFLLKPTHAGTAKEKSGYASKAKLSSNLTENQSASTKRDQLHR